VYFWPVVPVSYHDFFGGCATVAGALIGLLFVAISVSPLAGDSAHADHQVRAGAAFSALVNTLVISLVALLPTANLGPAGIALAAAGLATTAGLIIFLYREHQERIQPSDISLLVVLLVLYGLQLADGIRLDGAPGNISNVSNQGVLLIGFFLFAIARAWQLVGARNPSLLSTVAGMARRPASEGLPLTDGDQAGTAGPAASPDDPG
jgi:hypothetical protein